MSYTIINYVIYHNSSFCSFRYTITQVAWTSPFPILGLFGGIFHFIQILNNNSVGKQWKHWSDAAVGNFSELPGSGVCPDPFTIKMPNPKITSPNV